MAIHLILNCEEDSFTTVWGTVCSSWIHMNCGTSRRSKVCPEGDCRKPYVRAANEMVSRSLVCSLLIRVMPDPQDGPTALPHHMSWRELFVRATCFVADGGLLSLSMADGTAERVSARLWRAWLKRVRCFPSSGG